MTVAAFSDWFVSSWPAVGGALVTSVLVLMGLVLFVRLFGIRSFAKMSSFDFAVTVALGSVLASGALSKSPALPITFTVMATFFAMQWGIARLRIASDGFSKLVDNQAILVMAEGEIFADNLQRSGVTRGELIGKLREANVLEISHVRAVIVETTGDVSVLHGDPETPLAEELFEGVRDALRHPAMGRSNETEATTS